MESKESMGFNYSNFYSFLSETGRYPRKSNSSSLKVDVEFQEVQSVSDIDVTQYEEEVPWKHI